MGASNADEENDDRRMFPGTILYCEGRVKPQFRGMFHALGVILLLPAKIGTLLLFELNSSLEWMSLAVLAGGTLCSWGASSLFHCISWELHDEIKMQKLDHSAVFINIACSYTSIAALVVRQLSDEGFWVVMITTMILWGLCLWGIWHVHAKRTQRMKLWVSIVATTFPSYFYLSSRLTLNERAYTILGLLLYGVGATIYGKRLFDPIPHIFGFHEIFHICTVLATLCAFHLMWSLSQDLHQRCEPQQYSLWFTALKTCLAHTISTYQDVCSSPDQ